MFHTAAVMCNTSSYITSTNRARRGLIFYTCRMDEALLQDVSDPSDWTGSWSELSHLDTTLRCGLCYVRILF